MRKEFILSRLISTSVFLAGCFLYAQPGDFKSHLNNFQDLEYSDNYLAKKYLDSAEYLLPAVKDPLLIGDFHLYTGWYYQDISKYDKSKAAFFKALKEYESINAYQKMADAYGNIGNAYFDVDELSNALNYHQKSLVLNEKIAHTTTDSLSKDAANRGKAYAYTNIAAIHLRLKNYDKSLNYELSSLEYEIMRDDSLGMAISYQGIGELYHKIGNNDSAYYFLNFARKIFEKENYSYGLIRSLTGLAEVEEDKIKSRNLLLIALDISIESQEPFSRITILSELLKAKYQLPNQTLTQFTKDIKVLQKDSVLAETTYGTYRKLAEYYYRIGDFESSSEAYKSYLEYQQLDELQNRKDELTSLLVRNEFQLKSINDSLKIQTEYAQKSLEDERKIGNQKTIITIAIAGGVLMLGVLFFLFKSNKTKNINNRLLSAKNQRIHDQKALVDEKNKQITDSIKYAKRLQTAILPPISAVEDALTEVFILFKPKDVVSGDFYWFEQKGDLIFIAAADCTGHGVPGAMVSVVCSNALNRSVNEFGCTKPNTILDKTRELVIKTFARSGADVKDGMDISLCVIDKKSKKIRFSGANNPVWICRETNKISDDTNDMASIDGKSLIEFKGDKQPVGLYSAAKQFSETEIIYNETDTFYLFTDGFADQFGGAEGKKLKYKTFKKLLLEQQENVLIEQNKFLNNFIVDWMGDLEQVDDICVIGFKP